MTIECYSDGCWGEQKQRKFCFAIKHLCNTYELLAIILTFAPIAGFKGIWDSWGYVANEDVRKLTLTSNDIINDDVAVYDASLRIQKKNPVPLLQLHAPFLTHSGRDHFLIADISEKDRIQKRLVALESISAYDTVDPNVIYLNANTKEINSRQVQDIRSMSQTRVNSNPSDMSVYFRKQACNCLACAEGDFSLNNCVQMDECGRWYTRKLSQIVLAKKSEKTLEKAAKRKVCSVGFGDASNEAADDEAHDKKAEEGEEDDEEDDNFDYE